jgi:hypothetical protein
VVEVPVVCSEAAPGMQNAAQIVSSPNHRDDCFAGIRNSVKQLISYLDCARLVSLGAVPTLHAPRELDQRAGRSARAS